MSPKRQFLAGADGCRAGWVVVSGSMSGAVECTLVPRLEDLLRDPDRSPAVLAVDMVIGLPDVAVAGGRTCDREARRVLSPEATSSVFSPPCRGALAGRSYKEALAINKAASGGIGFSIQAYGLFPKIREVDDLVRARGQEVIREVHPEVIFRRMNGGDPLPKKKSREGRAERLRLLEAAGICGVQAFFDRWLRKDVQPDDIIDAAAALWTARRIAAGRAEAIPAAAEAERDGVGLLMQIRV